MKEITITVPDNCELKQDGNTYTIVEKEKKVTYDNVAEQLFENKQPYFIDENCVIIKSDICRYTQIYYSNNCTSKKQAEKLLAINKLMNVAKYLNGDWQPDWSDATEFKYYLLIEEDEIITAYVCDICCNDIYFKSEELAQQAIEILGEETIKLALCTDY